MTPIITATFRQAVPADSPAIAALHAESWHTTYRGMLTDAYLDGPVREEREHLWKSHFEATGTARWYVGLAEVEGALVGFACVLLDEEPAWGAYLDNLHVSAGFQGRGIGRQLFARAVRWVMAIEPGWPLHLWVFEANAGACRFYNTLRGQAVQRGFRLGPDGTEVPSLRYVWHDVGQLLGVLESGVRSAQEA
jgi:GNAT superfamily N-acetyltransferase